MVKGWYISMNKAARGITMALAALCIRRSNNTASTLALVPELALVSDAELQLALVSLPAPVPELALVSSSSSNAPAPTAARMADPNKGALSNSPKDG